MKQLVPKVRRYWIRQVQELAQVLQTAQLPLGRTHEPLPERWSEGFRYLARDSDGNKTAVGSCQHTEIGLRRTATAGEGHLVFRDGEQKLRTGEFGGCRKGPRHAFRKASRLVPAVGERAG